MASRNKWKLLFFTIMKLTPSIFNRIIDETDPHRWCFPWSYGKGSWYWMGWRKFSFRHRLHHDANRVRRSSFLCPWWRSRKGYVLSQSECGTSERTLPWWRTQKRLTFKSYVCIRHKSANQPCSFQKFTFLHCAAQYHMWCLCKCLTIY